MGCGHPLTLSPVPARVPAAPPAAAVLLALAGEAAAAVAGHAMACALRRSCTRGPGARDAASEMMHLKYNKGHTLA